jgi:hypothetical protein
MIGVPMKRDYLAYLTGFEKSNMGKKLMNTPVKERWISAEAAEYKLFYRSDNYSL